MSLHTVVDPMRLGASMPQASAVMLRWRPDALFTTGGYVAVPVVGAAALQRVPTVLWEGNLVPGRSVRATARMATVLATSFEGTCRRLGGNCFVTGTPIRAFAGRDRDAARRRVGVPVEGRCVLVFGGSQAVRRLNQAVSEALPRLLERASVVHLTGEPAYAEALRRREALPADRRDRYRPYPFLREDMADALAAADLLVGRAGSSTLAEACAVGLPMIVVPYPHADAHQVANARHLADAGALRIIPDEAFDAAALLEASAVLADEPELERMRAAARRFSRPGAANAVAELVLALAERQSLPTADALERLSRAPA